MRRLLIVPAILTLAVGLGMAFRTAGPELYLGGIQVHEQDHGSWIRALEESGMNTVAVTVYARQGDWDSPNLWYEEEEPWVLAEARAARERGLRVVLVLRVALDHAFESNRFLWHGMIMPARDVEVEEWFRRYRRFTLHWARLAEREGIDVLAVGSELNALTSTAPVDQLPVLEEYWANEEKVERETDKIRRHAESLDRRHLWTRGYEGYASPERFLDDHNRAHAAWARRVAWLGSEDPLARINARRRLLERGWRDLVAGVREVYGGTVTYAANFDQYQDVGFWDALDLISINAYFPLRRRLLDGAGDRDLEALFTARWRSILREIDRLRSERGIPDHRVLFSELGYVRRADCTIEPWAATGFSVLPSATGPRLVIWEERPENRRERALALAALYRAELDLGGEMLAGILYWKLSTEPAHEEVEPFALIIGDRAPDDPLLAELRRFTGRRPLDAWRRRLLGPRPAG